MKHAAVAALMLLSACAASEPPTAATTAAAIQLTRLGSDAEIDAAQSAPLSGDSVAWNREFAPFTLIGNIHYVGMEGVSAWLITTPDGHILLDGGLPQSAPRIIAHIAALGFDIRDVKLLLNSHAHYDHSGGLASLQRASGARMVASAADRPALEAGHVDYGAPAGVQTPPVRVDRVIADGETASLGGATLTAHLTPGHTKGCTSWSMPVRSAHGAEHVAFFHCSSTVAGQSLAPESYPGVVADYRATFARVREFEADIFLANHGVFFDLAAKRARQVAGDANAFVEPGALQAFNAELERAFETELARQQAAVR